MNFKTLECHEYQTFLTQNVRVSESGVRTETELGGEEWSWSGQQPESEENMHSTPPPPLVSHALLGRQNGKYSKE